MVGSQHVLVSLNPPIYDPPMESCETIVKYTRAGRAYISFRCCDVRPWQMIVEKVATSHIYFIACPQGWPGKLTRVLRRNGSWSNIRCHCDTEVHRYQDRRRLRPYEIECTESRTKTGRLQIECIQAWVEADPTNEESMPEPEWMYLVATANPMPEVRVKHQTFLEFSNPRPEQQYKVCVHTGAANVDMVLQTIYKSETDSAIDP